MKDIFLEVSRKEALEHDTAYATIVCDTKEDFEDLEKAIKFYREHRHEHEEKLKDEMSTEMRQLVESAVRAGFDREQSVKTVMLMKHMGIFD